MQLHTAQKQFVSIITVTGKGLSDQNVTLYPVQNKFRWSVQNTVPGNTTVDPLYIKY